MEPKMTPKSSPKRPPNSQTYTSKLALDCWSNFSSILDDFGGSKMAPKSTPPQKKNAFGAQGSLGGLQGTPLGSIFDPGWPHFEAPGG